PLVDSACRQAQAIHEDRRFHNVGLTDATIAGDADAITQLLWILVDNGAKFTRAGGSVEVGLRQHDSTVLLTVADDGIGVAADEQERIFQRFYQADPARSTNGTGLGLSIARWIGEEQHGTISGRHNSGPGSTFAHSLPHHSG